MVRRRSRALGEKSELFVKPLFTLTLSTFLKIAMLSDEKAQRKEIEPRLSTEKRRAYDRYGNLRKLFTKSVIEKETLEALEAEAEIRIKNKWEKRDTLSALRRLGLWLKTLSTWTPFKPKKARWVSPHKLFMVKVSPEAGTYVDGVMSTFYVYNTEIPDLDARYGKVGALMTELAYSQAGLGGKFQHTLLALRHPNAYVLPEEDRDAAQVFLDRAVNEIELLILEILEDQDSIGG